MQTSSVANATEIEFSKAFTILHDMCDTIKPLTMPLGGKFGSFGRIEQKIEHHLATLHKVSEEYLTLKYELLEMQNRLDEDKLTNAEMVRESIFQETSETTNVICLYRNCFMNCHLECDCAKKCSCFNSGVCIKCEHSWDHHKKGKVRNDTKIVQKHEDMNIRSEQMIGNMEKLEGFLEELKENSRNFASNVVKKTIDGLKKQVMKIRPENKEKILKILDDIAENQTPPSTGTLL